MKRKAFIEIHGLMEILLVLIVLVVLLGFTGTYSRIVKSFGDDTLCEASFVASAMTKTFGRTNIDPKCKTDRITLVENTEEEGETETGGEKKALLKDYPNTVPEQPWDTAERVRLWNSNPNIPDQNKYPYSGTGGFETEDQYITARYNMDKIFADELQRCWTITGQGKLPMFDNYWEFIGCRDEDGVVRDCEDVEGFWQNLEQLILEDQEVRPTANFCVLCARIKFDENIQSKMPDLYDSINVWMANNPHQIGVETSYYEFVLNDIQKNNFFNRPQFRYSTDEPYAVVFIRTNFHNYENVVISGIEITDDILDFFPFYEKRVGEGEIVRYYNALEIIPYRELPNQCDYVVGSYV